jgi:hypothetical protein
VPYSQALIDPLQLKQTVARNEKGRADWPSYGHPSVLQREVKNVDYLEVHPVHQDDVSANENVRTVGWWRTSMMGTEEWGGLTLSEVWPLWWEEKAGDRPENQEVLSGILAAAAGIFRSAKTL